MEIEVPSVNRVDEIRDVLVGMQGKRLRVRANMGRSRVVERVGTLVATHPSLFMIQIEERRGRVSRQSYQYVDILTGLVELFDDETDERIFEYTFEE